MFVNPLLKLFLDVVLTFISPLTDMDNSTFHPFLLQFSLIPNKLNTFCGSGSAVSDFLFGGVVLEFVHYMMIYNFPTICRNVNFTR
jgi:hypothetical protein